jgi:hypothetical protein
LKWFIGAFLYIVIMIAISILCFWVHNFVAYVAKIPLEQRSGATLKHRIHKALKVVVAFIAFNSIIK